jgi:hypothetical protein
MTPVHRSLRAIFAAAAISVMTAPAIMAASLGPVSGSGRGGVSTGGSLEPVGDGRFRVSGREYHARLQADDPLGCFRGQTRVTETAILSVPHYAGSHEGAIVISGEAGTMQLRYRGRVDRYAGRGDWWVDRGTGGCAAIGGGGNYETSLRSGNDPEYRIELRGTLTPDQ